VRRGVRSTLSLSLSLSLLQPASAVVAAHAEEEEEEDWLTDGRTCGDSQTRREPLGAPPKGHGVPAPPEPSHGTSMYDRFWCRQHAIHTGRQG
jgi:hypothetical protein